MLRLLVDLLAQPREDVGDLADEVSDLVAGLLDLVARGRVAAADGREPVQGAARLGDERLDAVDVNAVVLLCELAAYGPAGPQAGEVQSVTMVIGAGGCRR